MTNNAGKCLQEHLPSMTHCSLEEKINFTFAFLVLGIMRIEHQHEKMICDPLWIYLTLEGRILSMVVDSLSWVEQGFDPALEAGILHMGRYCFTFLLISKQAEPDTALLKFSKYRRGPQNSPKHTEGAYPWCSWKNHYVGNLLHW